MKTTVQVSETTRMKLNDLKTGKATHDDVISLLIESRATGETTVSKDGRVRGLSGKTILYRIKETEKHIESDGVITLPIPKPETTKTEEPLISIGKEESKEEGKI